MERKPSSVERFAPRAQAYAAYRPSYPPTAIDAVLADLVSPAALTIADVGAGTGISARLFAQRGCHVIAIEPNAKMRAQAPADLNVRWQDGTAQQTGLADKSVDLVVAAQAFHWFATDAAMREFARIARRRAALLQYERDERDAFTCAYGEIVRAYATDDTEALRRRGLETFARFPNALVTTREFPAAQRLDRQALLGRAASSSYLPSSGPQAAALAADLHALFERYEAGGSVELRMVTYALTADFT